MRQTYRVVSSLIALGVLVQAGAIAFGWFEAVSDVENGLVVDDNWRDYAGLALHSVNGMMVMPLLGLVLLGVSFAAARSVPKARKWAGIVFGLIVLQVLLAFVSFAAPIVGALHGINALVLFGAAARAGMLARPAAAAASSAPSVADGIPAPRRRSASGTGADLPG
jgi:heme A synthase